MIKPGCYGIGLVHGANSTCKGCGLQKACRKSALNTLTEVHTKMDVSDLLRHYEDINTIPHSPSAKSVPRGKSRVTTKVQMTPDQERRISHMPVKAAKMARTLYGNGIDLKKSLTSRDIPVSGFMTVPCHMLMEGGFTKKELKAALMERFSHWSERTAEGQLSVAFALLNGLDCLQQRGSRFELKAQ